ncbi:unnamed protein product [Cunninghamella blakesleeana]
MDKKSAINTSDAHEDLPPSYQESSHHATLNNNNNNNNIGNNHPQNIEPYNPNYQQQQQQHHTIILTTNTSSLGNNNNGQEERIALLNREYQENAFPLAALFFIFGWFCPILFFIGACCCAGNPNNRYENFWGKANLIMSIAFLISSITYSIVIIINGH